MTREDYTEKERINKNPEVKRVIFDEELYFHVEGLQGEIRRLTNINDKLEKEINTFKDIMKAWGRQLLELKRLAHTHFDPNMWDPTELEHAETENENGVRK